MLLASICHHGKLQGLLGGQPRQEAFRSLPLCSPPALLYNPYHGGHDGEEIEDDALQRLLCAVKAMRCEMEILH